MSEYIGESVCGGVSVYVKVCVRQRKCVCGGKQISAEGQVLTYAYSKQPPIDLYLIVFLGLGKEVLGASICSHPSIPLPLSPTPPPGRHKPPRGTGKSGQGHHHLSFSYSTLQA